MPFVYYVSELEKDVPLDAERLLRLLGVGILFRGIYAGAGTGKTRVCSADYEAPISTDSAALQYNDQLCGEKSAHACASLLETAGSQYAGSNRGMPIITAANQHAIPRYAGILSP